MAEKMIQFEEAQGVSYEASEVKTSLKKIKRTSMEFEINKIYFIAPQHIGAMKINEDFVAVCYVFELTESGVPCGMHAVFLNQLLSSFYAEEEVFDKDNGKISFLPKELFVFNKDKQTIESVPFVFTKRKELYKLFFSYEKNSYVIKRNGAYKTKLKMVPDFQEFKLSCVDMDAIKHCFNGHCPIL